MAEIQPADVAAVAIRERTVFGVVAHRAECLVPGCGKRGKIYDAKRDGGVRSEVIRWAEAHGAKHTAAADVLAKR